MMEDPPEAEENILYGDDFSGGGSSSEYQQAASHLPLDQDRLIPSAQSTGQGETTIGDSDRGGRAEVCQPPRMSRVSDDGGGDTAREKEMTASYDLLCEDDPDDFVTLEIPTDAMTTDSDAPPPSDVRRKGGFLDNIRRGRNLGGVTTVITGSKRMRGGMAGGGAKAVEGSKVVALHELSDDPRVVQEPGGEGEEEEEEEEEGRKEGGMGRLIREIDLTELGAQYSPMEKNFVPSRSRQRSNDLVPSDHTPLLEGTGSREHSRSHDGEDESRDQLSDLLSESHKISHKHNQQYVSPGRVHVEAEEQGEEFQGITAGIGLKNNSQLPTHAIDDASLRADMLMSMNVGGGGGGGGGAPEMSVQQSLHIGLAPMNLQISKIKLLSDEETAKEASRARIDSIELDSREFADEDVESATWCEHQKHVFVLSLSGKPVYSRYGKEDKLVNMFGIMQALVSFVQDDDRDNLRSIVAGKHKFVFVCRGPLVLVSVAQTSQSETQLAIQLNYVFNQILSVLTNTQLSQIFDKMPGYDLRYLLQGSEKFVDNILNLIDVDPSFTIGGVRCLSMSVSLRQIITSILMQCRSKDVLYAVVVVNNHLVTYIKPKEHNLVPVDIHLIINLVDASTSFKSAESWTPICLPKFNDTGFLHAHVSYLPDDSPACLLLFSANKEKFFEMQECQQRIIEKLDKQGCLDHIKDSVKESGYNIDHLQAPEIRHFLYKSRKTSCVTSPQIPPVYSEKEDEKRLYSLYMFMHEILHSRAWPTKILYHVGNKEALLGWRTAGFDLYIVFDPLIIKSQAILLGNKLIKWISREEDKLIITSSHTF